MSNFYPGARCIEADKYLRHTWAAGSPQGITIHDSAGDSLDGAIAALVANGLRYHLIIDRDGTVVQTALFSRGVWHAGAAFWNGKSPNRSHVSICLIGWGKLKLLDNGTAVSWCGSAVPASEARIRSSNIDHMPYHWQAASEAQVDSLRVACLWLMRTFTIASFDICGHDEAALPLGRKEDPGGTLPWTMPAFRAYIHGESLARGPTV